MNAMPPEASATRIELALISHTNAGKTSLARTLLGKDIGEVRDAPHVTELAEPHTLLATGDGDELRLWDTPGFGDSARLMKRLRVADNPIGWLLREVWDKYRDRPFWCSQQAVRAARDSADVVLYLVNAAEDPRDAGYVVPEMQVLRWVGRPIIVLLNQTGPPRPQSDEAAEIERWREHLAPLGEIGNVLALDAFARCWVQEAVLLDAVARVLPEAKRPALARLRDEWTQQNRARFDASMRTLARHLATAAREREPLPRQDGHDGNTAWQKLLRAVGAARNQAEAARTLAMTQLAQRLDATSRAATEELIALHHLHGSATQVVLERLQQNYQAREPVNEAGGALLGSVLTGALTGLKADLAAGGMTLGAGLLVGGIVGGLAGAGAVRGINALRGEPDVRWSEAFLDGLVRSSVLRYLAVAHFGRGRGRWVEGEAPAFWQAEVEDVVQADIATWHALWAQLRDPQSPAADTALADALRNVCTNVLLRLYPGVRDVLRPDPDTRRGPPSGTVTA